LVFRAVLGQWEDRLDKSAIAVHRTIHESHAVLGIHRHREPYVALVLRGSYVETGPDGAWTCQAGDLVLHPPFHLHADRMSARGARVLNFVLPLAASRALAMSTYTVVRPLRPEQVEQRAQRDPLSALAEAIAEGETSAPAAPSDWCSRVALALVNHTPSLVGLLARNEGISPEHASRAFRARYGIGPAAFRAEQRLRDVLRLLVETRDSLSDIACLAGVRGPIAHESRDQGRYRFESSAAASASEDAVGLKSNPFRQTIAEPSYFGT
jgi:AraC family transcriptional regulator